MDLLTHYNSYFHFIFHLGNTPLEYLLLTTKIIDLKASYEQKTKYRG